MHLQPIMQSLHMNHNGSNAAFGPRNHRPKSLMLGVLAGLVLFAVLPARTQDPPKAPPPAAPAAQPGVAQQSQTQSAITLSAAPARTQISADCANLLELAKQLKIEMNRAGNDTLSLGVIRKAAEIQQLTHKIQKEMKPELGKSGSNAREPAQKVHGG